MQLIISFFHLLFHQAIQSPAHVTQPVNDVQVCFYMMQTPTFMSGSLIHTLFPQPYWSRSTRYQCCLTCQLFLFGNEWITSKSSHSYSCKHGRKGRSWRGKWGLHIVTKCSTKKSLHHYTKLPQKSPSLLEREWQNFTDEYIFQDRPRRALKRNFGSLCLRLKYVAAKEILYDGSLDVRDLSVVNVQEWLHQPQ